MNSLKLLAAPGPSHSSASAEINHLSPGFPTLTPGGAGKRSLSTQTVTEAALRLKSKTETRL